MCIGDAWEVQASSLEALKTFCSIIEECSNCKQGSWDTKGHFAVLDSFSCQASDFHVFGRTNECGRSFARQHRKHHIVDSASYGPSTFSLSRKPHIPDQKYH